MEKRELSFPQLIWISFWNVGIMFAFQAEFTFGTPLFRELDLDYVATSAAWAAGPMTGFLQPIVGILSDRWQTRWGRRRPWILGGAIVALIGMAFFCNSVPIGKALGDTPDTHKYAIIVCISSLWLMNSGLNIVQAMGWTLVLDLCSTKQQQQGNGVVAFLNSSAGVICNVLGFVNLSTFIPITKTNAQATFYVGIILTIISIIPTLIVGKETINVIDVDKFTNIQETKKENGLVKTWKAFKGMSKPVMRILIVFFFTNASYTPFMFYFTDYVGRLNGGDGSAAVGTESREKYDQGVQYGSLGLALNLLVSALFSITIHHSQRIFGVKTVYSTAHFIGAICLSLPLLQYAPISTHSLIIITIIWCGMLGILNSVLNSVAYALIGMNVSKEDTGLYMGILNTMQVVAQLLTSFIATIIMSKSHSTGLGLVLGGGLSFITGFLVFILEVEKSTSQNEESDPLIGEK